MTTAGVWCTAMALVGVKLMSNVCIPDAIQFATSLVVCRVCDEKNTPVGTSKDKGTKVWDPRSTWSKRTLERSPSPTQPYEKKAHKSSNSSNGQGSMKLGVLNVPYCQTNQAPAQIKCDYHCFYVSYVKFSIEQPLPYPYTSEPSPFRGVVVLHVMKHG